MALACALCWLPAGALGQATGAVEPRPGDTGAADTGAALRAYHAALAQKRLDPGGALSVEQLGNALSEAEAQLALGRRDEAIALLAGLCESPRFAALAGLAEGRAAVFVLGDALGRAGAHDSARAYLSKLIQTPRVDSWYRRAVSSLVDVALQSGQLDGVLADLKVLPAGPSQPWAGEVSYLLGLSLEHSGRADDAVRAYTAVPANSRFWAQATYRSGLIHVEHQRFGAGEQNFCRIADPKQTPKVAPLFGGNDFFRVRDLSRLALGRVAHEQYRFDDAGYYYHLVPGDSERLPEALYESATSRYEAKDYEAAHRLLNELSRLERHHAYEDEAWILDAYVDLARCQFPRADARLNEFLKRYEPVLEATRRLTAEPRALRALLDGNEGGARHNALGMGYPSEVSDLLVSSVRVDSGYGAVTRRLSDLEHQISGLEAASREIGVLANHLEAPDAAKPRLSSAASLTESDRLRRVADQSAALRRMLREAGRDVALVPQVTAIKQDLIAIEADAERIEQRIGPGTAPAASSDPLQVLLASDAQLATELLQAARAERASLLAEQDRLAHDAVTRLELRLGRLVRRARAGRIETVLGKKRALELEVEALSQGFLPRGAVDSLDAARYLADDEEYWPFDGEDWDDEYMGGEGLK